MNSIFIIEVHFPHGRELVDQLPKRNVKVKMSSTFTYVLKRGNVNFKSLINVGEFFNALLLYIIRALWSDLSDHARGSLPSARVTSPEPDSISHRQYKDKDYN